MALKTPYKQHHYMGEFANDGAALTFIQTNHWDSTKDGTGTPEVGMLYYNTTSSEMTVWTGASWVAFSTGASGTFIRVDGTLPFTGPQSMGGQRLTSLPIPTAAADAASKEYVDQQRDWQESVLDKDLAAPPGSPADGARYIVAAAPSGAWVGHTNDITQWRAASTEWLFYTPTEGTTTRVEDEDMFYVFDGTSWGSWAASTSHNELAGIQGGSAAGGGERYHVTSAQHTDLTTGIEASTQHIHDARYFTETELGSTTGGSEGAALVGTDTKANLNNATTVEVALTELNTRNPSARSSGSGNPNGVVSGAVGDTYVDETNDVKYMNTTGTNTGWDVM